jgi:hypothetical protein
MLLDLITLHCGFLLEFGIVRHFGSERSSLFGLHDFGGIHSPPYSIGVQLSLLSGKNQSALIIYKYLSTRECSFFLVLHCFGVYIVFCQLIKIYQLMVMVYGLCSHPPAIHTSHSLFV